MFRFRQLALVAAVGLTLSVGLNTGQAEASDNNGQDPLGTDYFCPNPPITNGDFESGLDGWDWEFNADNWGMGLADGYVEVVADPSSDPDIVPAPSVPAYEEVVTIAQVFGLSSIDTDPSTSSYEYPDDSPVRQNPVEPAGGVLLMRSTASS
ncbi:MAG: hypothetical protein O7B26_09335, partial [Planctomycetota bacterium]|nr:hypothetical protein [Planctomycetota bacterium]